jgi:hypothetical protein
VPNKLRDKLIDITRYIRYGFMVAASRFEIKYEKIKSEHMWTKFKEYLAKYSAVVIFILIFLVAALVGGLIWRNNYLSNKVKAAQEEADRIQGNYDASLDTIRVFKDKNGIMVSEISAYKIKVSELNDKYNNLFKLYVKEKNKPPIYIVEYTTDLNEKISNVSTLVTDTSITFFDSAYYNDGNYRSISGKIPYKLIYHIKKDMVTKYAFEQALYYAYTLEEKGVEDPKVMAFRDDGNGKYKEISIKEALNDRSGKGVIFKVKILESNQNLSLDDLSNKYGLDKSLLTSEIENNVYTYYVGRIIPFQNVEPALDFNTLDIFTSLHTKPAEVTFHQGMLIHTGLYKDKKTGKTMIDIKTNYPDLTFTNIVGASIMDDKESRKVARAFRKEFGIGIGFGYGFALVKDANNNLVLKNGPTFSIGINWTPRFLQFGPSK